MSAEQEVMFEDVPPEKLPRAAGNVKLTKGRNITDGKPQEHWIRCIWAILDKYS